MKFIIKASKNVNITDWNKLLMMQSFSTSFQNANYDKPTLLYRDCQPWYIIVENENGEIVGQLYTLMDFYEPNVHKTITNYFLKKFKLGSQLLWRHGPIIHDKAYRTQIMSEILIAVDNLAKENQIDLVSGTSCPLDGTFDSNVCHKLNFDVKPWMSYIINLNNESNSIFLSLDKKIRYDIRKANESGLVFEVGNDMSDLIEFTKLKFRLKNQKFPEYDETIQKNTWDWLYKENLRKLFMVKYKDELIGGINANIFNGNLYQTSVINSHKELNGGSFLTWNAISWSAKEKNRSYDLGGANPHPSSEKEKGISFYKSKWGGESYEQQIFTKIYHSEKLQIAKVLANPKVLSSKFFRGIQS
jgi:hypothetical protein